tara:strand:- start:77 stop:421 length:345 start_codon:yes stop_codon:yes gene_type:complete
MPDSISANLASNAYSRTSNLSGIDSIKDIAGKDDSDGSGESGGGVFLNMVKDGLSQSIDTVKRGEQMSAAAVTGEADLTDVVQAVTAAELQVQTVTAIRDRMISAYQEIMRMPI